jgi:hypothetical protein
MHCEVFVASAAMDAGFACCNLNELIPGCYDQSMMMMEIPGYGRPMGAGFEGRDGIRMYHPVYAAEEWLSRTRRVFSGTPWGHELQLRAVEGLVRDEAHARETGDVVMADAIDQLRDLLDPKWQEYFGTRPGQA